MAFHHADETFFIDSDEHLHNRIDPRTAAKMIARNRQDIIAGELSRLAGDEYLEDIMQHMRQMEASLHLQFYDADEERCTWEFSQC